MIDYYYTGLILFKSSTLQVLSIILHLIFFFSQAATISCLTAALSTTPTSLQVQEMLNEEISQGYCYWLLSVCVEVNAYTCNWTYLFSYWIHLGCLLEHSIHIGRILWSTNAPKPKLSFQCFHRWMFLSDE